MEPQHEEEIQQAEHLSRDETSFQIVSVNALYSGSERGLQADLHAIRALGGFGAPVCTALIGASHGTVTDVVEVPSDTVRSQLEHIQETSTIDGIRLGMLAHPKIVSAVFEVVREAEVPIVLDCITTGPSGETVLSSRGVEALLEHLAVPDLVTLGRKDAELIAGMEIQSLDDAQVALQRVSKRGASYVLIRCGQIKRRHFEKEGEVSPYMTDLFYDGDEFGMFEGPHVAHEQLRGASSVLSVALLKGLLEERPLVEVLQRAKGYVTEAIRHAHKTADHTLPDYYWNAHHTNNDE